MANDADSPVGPLDEIGEIPDLEDLLKLLEDASGGIGVLKGEDAEGFGAPRAFEDVEPKLESSDRSNVAVRAVQDAARRLEESARAVSGEPGAWSIEEELRKVEEEPAADVLQAGFEYPRVASVTGEFEVLRPEEDPGDFAEFEERMLDGEVEGDPLAVEGVELMETGAAGIGVGVVAPSVLERLPGDVSFHEDPVLDPAQKRVAVADDKVGSAVADLLEAGATGESDFLGGDGGRVTRGVNGHSEEVLSEASQKGANGSSDLVSFIRDGLEGRERAVYDRLVASFEAEGKAGDATAYDFLLLCGFTATILRRGPAVMDEPVPGSGGPLLRAVALLQDQLRATHDSFKEVRLVPQELVKVSASLEEMSKGTEFHLSQSGKLQSEALRRFNTSLEEVAKRFSERVDKVVSLVGRKRKLSFFNALWFGLLSLVAGIGLATLFEAALWQELKAMTLTEGAKEVERKVEAFRKRVDEVQPERSVLGRLAEAGVSMRAQPGEFTDLYGRSRKAFIVSLSSSGTEKVGKVDRDERQTDIYFFEP